MEFSKHVNTKSNAVIAGLLCLAIIPGCFQVKTRSNSDEGLGLASFDVGAVSGESKTLQMLSGLSLPSQKQFSFKTCITERKTTGKVANTVFTLKKGEAKQELRSDNEGCVTWTEDVSVDPLGDEAFLPMNRKIVAVDGTDHSGSRDLKIAINPWNFTGVGEVLDLSKGKIPAGATLSAETDVQARLKGQFSQTSTPDKAVTKSLFFDKFTLSSLAQETPGEGFSKTLEFRFQPKLSINNAGKQVKTIDLSEAQLQAVAVIMAIVPKNKTETAYAVWASPEAVLVQKDGNAFRAKFDVSFAASLPESARYLLLLKIAPIKTGPAKLMPVEALIEMGSIAQISSSTVLPNQIKDMNIGGTFNYDQAITALTNVPVAQPAPAPAQPAPAPPTED